MKTRFYSLVFSIFSLLFSIFSFSQSGADYKFQNSVLVSGTALQVRSVYRFPSVKKGYDALVEVVRISSNVLILEIDRISNGYSEAFQPLIQVNGLTNGSVEFNITFVDSGTSTPATQKNVSATALDIDGRGGVVYESNTIDMRGGIYEFQAPNNQIAITTFGTAYTAKSITGQLFGNAVDTVARENMFGVTSADLSSFKFTTGAWNIISPQATTRYASLYFKRFSFANSNPLALPKIQKFNGICRAQQVMLTWQTEKSNDLETCFIERSGEGSGFTAIASFNANDKKAYENQFIDKVSHEGKYLYRLKLVSKTEEVKYSNILAFTLEGASNPLMVYSAKGSSTVTARINSDTREPAILQLTDMAGNTVYNKQVNLHTGINSFSISDLQIQHKASFVMTVRTGKNILAKKIMLM